MANDINPEAVQALTQRLTAIDPDEDVSEVEALVYKALQHWERSKPGASWILDSQCADVDGASLAILLSRHHMEEPDVQLLAFGLSVALAPTNTLDDARLAVADAMERASDDSYWLSHPEPMKARRVMLAEADWLYSNWRSLMGGDADA